jgi:integrase/recombinase XerD
MTNEATTKDSWDVRMDGDMVIVGLSERTREAYLRAVRQLANFHRMADPGTLEEQHVKDYLLWLRTEKRAAPGTLSIAFNCIRFFHHHSCPRDWITQLKFRIPKETKLPAVLTIDDVQRIMHAIVRPRFRAYFWTVYSCGLRLNEALALQAGDIDSERMRILIHRGKGAKDRLVPLLAATLDVLHDAALLFPKTAYQGGVVLGTNQTMSESTVQGALRRVVVELKFTRNISVHCLRHSYATHLREAGVNLRMLQQYLGRRGRFVRAAARNRGREQQLEQADDCRTGAHVAEDNVLVPASDEYRPGERGREDQRSGADRLTSCAHAG